MLNIGVRPTFPESKQHFVIEVNIFEFKQNIYGQNIEVIFVRKIRNEKKFINAQHLIKQLKADQKKIAKLF